MNLTASLQVGLLGGVRATLQAADVTFEGITALIDRDVEVVADNGMTMVKRTVISLLKAEVGHIKTGFKITVGSEVFTVNEIIGDDGSIVEVFVRG